MALQMVRSRFVTRFLNHGKHRTHRKEAEPFLRPEVRVFRVFRGSRMLFLTRFFNHGKHPTHRKEAEPFLRSEFCVFRVFRGSRMLFVTRFSTTENTEHTERKLSLSYVLNSVYSVCSVV